jgi:hypothetical protein
MDDKAKRELTTCFHVPTSSSIPRKGSKPGHNKNARPRHPPTPVDGDGVVCAAPPCTLTLYVNADGTSSFTPSQVHRQPIKLQGALASVRQPVARRAVEGPGAEYGGYVRPRKLIRSNGRVMVITEEYTLPPPAEATQAVPGTEDKIQVMRARYGGGRHIHHPDDLRADPGGTITITAEELLRLLMMGDL